MKPAIPKDILDSNMQLLKTSFSKLHEQLLGRAEVTLFLIQPFDTPHGQINFSATRVIPDV